MKKTKCEHLEKIFLDKYYQANSMAIIGSEVIFESWIRLFEKYKCKNCKKTIVVEIMSRDYSNDQQKWFHDTLKNLKFAGYKYESFR
jgi:hypothetical protein